MAASLLLILTLLFQTTHTQLEQREVKDLERTLKQIENRIFLQEAIRRYEFRIEVIPDTEIHEKNRELAELGWISLGGAGISGNTSSPANIVRLELKDYGEAIPPEPTWWLGRCSPCPEATLWEGVLPPWHIAILYYREQE